MRKAIIAATVAALLAAGAAQVPAVAQTTPAASDWRAIAPENLLVIDTSKGRVLVELIPVAAPNHAERIRTLANQGFYDGLTFHRIISGFMIQGGDPNGNGTGGSEKTIKGEFSANGVENDISHVRGVISMARANDPDSGSSQFFIVHEDSTFLDGQYAAFGHVTDGMDVVDAIGRVPTDESDRPISEVKIIEAKMAS